MNANTPEGISEQIATAIRDNGTIREFDHYGPWNLPLIRKVALRAANLAKQAQFELALTAAHDLCTNHGKIDADTLEGDYLRGQVELLNDLFGATFDRVQRLPGDYEVDGINERWPWIVAAIERGSL